MYVLVTSYEYTELEVSSDRCVEESGRVHAVVALRVQESAVECSRVHAVVALRVR